MNWKQGIPVALTYCGSIVGAGFATGREVIEFFTVYGRPGMLGVLVATLLLAVTGVVIIDIAQHQGVYSYRGLLETVLIHPVFVTVADGVFVLTLVMGTGVMSAAAAAILNPLGVPAMLGSGLFLGTCLLVLSRGARGFIQANTILVPGLTLIILIICGLQIAAPVVTPLKPGPVLSAMIYVALNTALAAVALSSLGNQLKPGVTWVGGVGGGVLTGFLLVAVYLSTSSVNQVLPEIPLTFFAQRWLGQGAWVYSFALLAAVLTTALANIHGLASRGRNPKTYFNRCVVTAGFGWLISGVGFGNLVAGIYPFLGYCNLVLMGGLCYYVGKRIVTLLR